VELSCGSEYRWVNSVIYHSESLFVIICIQPLNGHNNHLDSSSCDFGFGGSNDEISISGIFYKKTD
jgi:hypothetical protein